ncbi:MAG TPA: hypothetical protein VF823_03895 [Anaerolineales bacterium]
MNRIDRSIIFPLVLLLASCAGPKAAVPATSTPPAGLIPTGSPLPPYATPTPYDSAPTDGSLDTACRITIDLFFSFKQGFSNEAYRELFIPSSQYLADNITPPAEARILLKLMPASQWWQDNFPDKLIPGSLLPAEPNEYVYYAEFTYHYDPSTTPVSTFPDGWTLHMVADGPNRCKIKSYGKG